MNLRELDEQYDRAVVEPVIDYVNQATGIEWLSVGENLGNGPRYISNIKMRTWQGPLAGVYALVYMAEIARRRGVDGHAAIRTANVARNAVELWLDEAGPLEVRNSVREKVDAAWEAGRTEGRPDESR